MDEKFRTVFPENSFNWQIGSRTGFDDLDRFDHRPGFYSIGYHLFTVIVFGIIGYMVDLNSNGSYAVER